MSIFSKISNEYENMWKLIIRPERTTYPEGSLGPKNFQLEERNIQRNDF